MALIDSPRWTMFVLLLLLALLPQLITSFEGSGQEEEETQHQRLKLYNWDYKDLGTNAFEDLSTVARQPIGLVESDTCPDGWVRFSDSCYYIEHELLGFAKAEKRCFEKQATLFVANSLDEWDAVRQHTPKSFFSWIGLVRFAQYEKSEMLPRWQTEGAVNPSKINWLVRPYRPILNGWNSYANCVAHYNPPLALDSASYAYFHSCTYLYHSICERNATLINLSQHFSA